MSHVEDASITVTETIRANLYFLYHKYIILSDEINVMKESYLSDCTAAQTYISVCCFKKKTNTPLTWFWLFSIMSHIIKMFAKAKTQKLDQGLCVCSSPVSI